MKWGKVIILLLDADDGVIRDDANAWKSRYQVPDKLCFANKGTAGYTTLSQNCLQAHSGLDAKVMVFCHGAADNVNGWSASYLANKLRWFGLTAAGLLTIKSCQAGAGTLLDDIKANLGGLQIGWLNGYTANAAQVPLVAAEGAGFLDFLLRCCTLSFLKMPDSWRIKVVKGNVNVSPVNGSSSRYSG